MSKPKALRRETVWKTSEEVHRRRSVDNIGRISLEELIGRRTIDIKEEKKEEFVALMSTKRFRAMVAKS